MVSHGNPKRSSTPGPKFSTSTSDVLSSSVKISVPCADFILSVILRLLQLSMVKYRLSTFGISRSCPRVISPRPGGSSLTTSAPRKPSICVQDGPDCTCAISRIRTPSKAFPMMELLCGHGHYGYIMREPTRENESAVHHRLVLDSPCPQCGACRLPVLWPVSHWRPDHCSG